MKTNTIKTIFAASLAAATLASSAMLFTGCGKSDQEKAMDAFNSALQSDLAEMTGANGGEKAAVTTTKPKEQVDLKGFRKALVDNKLYTVVYDGDEQSDYPHPVFYLQANATVEADGYTFTKKGEETANEYSSYYSSDWEISKNGVKYAECRLDTKWMGLEKPNTFQLQVNAPDRASYTDEADADFIGVSATNFDINIPAALSEADAKAKVADLEKLVKDNTPTGDYKDKNLKLESIYYFKDKQGEETLRGVYTYQPNLSLGLDNTQYMFVDGTYPFDDNGTVKALKWKDSPYKEEKELSAMSSGWIKLK